MPYSRQNDIFQSISYRSVKKGVISIRIATFKQNEQDSTALYDMQFDNVKVKKGLHELTLRFESNTKLHYADYSFLDIIKKFGLVPPGNYISYVTVQNSKAEKITTRKFYWIVDSTLAYKSRMRENLKDLLASKNQLKNAPTQQALVKSRKSSNK